MHFTVVFILISITLIVAVMPGSIELLYLTIGAVFSCRSKPDLAGEPPALHFCVVMPAHDEEDGIAQTVHSVLEAERGKHQVQLVVIADNCQDETADRARQAGARVMVRHDLSQRGKGFALDYAFQQLLPEGYDVFVVIDADTRIERNFFEAMARSFLTGVDGVQCAYRVSNAEDSVRARLMHIAWLAFNVLRPRGRQFWGQSVGLNGNGFALSQAALRAVPYEAGSISEDLEYHLRFVEAGRRIAFCPDTTVWSPAPVSGKSAATQRSRWEGGRFRMIREQLPRLLKGVMGGRLELLEPALELSLLPLAYHVLLLLLIVLTPWAPGQWIGMAGMLVVMLHVVCALFIGRAGWRDWVALGSAPFYVLWKLTLGRQLLAASAKTASWVRTERS